MSNCTEQTNAPLGEGGNAITSMGNFTSDDAKDTSYCQGYGAKYRANALVMTFPLVMFLCHVFACKNVKCSAPSKMLMLMQAPNSD